MSFAPVDAVDDGRHPFLVSRGGGSYPLLWAGLEVWDVVSGRLLHSIRWPRGMAVRAAWLVSDRIAVMHSDGLWILQL